ncbi:hypothetical protein J4Q44_G00379470 [Coregonus suidteri]|uniref:Uncharacterized protein n=1 Tax=Coregonus suidteri TaxID=861788 RepID=A0AAN8QJU7_9TELE
MRRSNKKTPDELFVTHCPFRHCLIRHRGSVSPSVLTGQMKQNFAEEERKQIALGLQHQLLPASAKACSPSDAAHLPSILAAYLD